MNVNYSECDKCKKQCREEQLIISEKGSGMICEDCYRKEKENK